MEVLDKLYRIMRAVFCRADYFERLPLERSVAECLQELTYPVPRQRDFPWDQKPADDSYRRLTRKLSSLPAKERMPHCWNGESTSEAFDEAFTACLG